MSHCPCRSWLRGIVLSGFAAILGALFHRCGAHRPRGGPTRRAIVRVSAGGGCRRVRSVGAPIQRRLTSRTPRSTARPFERSKGVEGFGAHYGTNANKKNAYGKCVSKTAKNKAEAREDSADAAEAKAAADCKKQKADDAAKFAEKYKNLGQCVKAQKKRATTSAGYVPVQERALHAGRPSCLQPYAGRWQFPGLDSNQQPSG